MTSEECKQELHIFFLIIHFREQKTKQSKSHKNDNPNTKNLIQTIVFYIDITPIFINIGGLVLTQK